MQVSCITSCNNLAPIYGRIIRCKNLDALQYCARTYKKVAKFLARILHYFMQESCTALCKIHALFYARFLHYLCKNLDLKILHSSCKTLAKNLQVMHDHLQETAFSCSKVITIILQDLARLVWLKH